MDGLLQEGCRPLAGLISAGPTPQPERGAIMLVTSSRRDKNEPVVLCFAIYWMLEASNGVLGGNKFLSQYIDLGLLNPT